MSDKDDWFQNISDWHDGLIDSPFDLKVATNFYRIHPKYISMTYYE